MLHYAYPTMGIYLEHMNRYSSEIAQLLHQKGRDSQSLPAFLCNAVLNPAAVFIYNYFLSVGISGWSRRTDPAHQPLGLHPLEIHQSLAPRPRQRVSTSQP